MGNTKTNYDIDSGPWVNNSILGLPGDLSVAEGQRNVKSGHYVLVTKWQAL